MDTDPAGRMPALSTYLIKLLFHISIDSSMTTNIAKDTSKLDLS